MRLSLKQQPKTERSGVTGFGEKAALSGHSVRLLRDLSAFPAAVSCKKSWFRTHSNTELAFGVSLDTVWSGFRLQVAKIGHGHVHVFSKNASEVIFVIIACYP